MNYVHLGDPLALFLEMRQDVDSMMMWESVTFFFY